MRVTKVMRLLTGDFWTQLNVNIQDTTECRKIKSDEAVDRGGVGTQHNLHIWDTTQCRHMRITKVMRLLTGGGGGWDTTQSRHMKVMRLFSRGVHTNITLPDLLR